MVTRRTAIAGGLSAVLVAGAAGVAGLLRGSPDSVTTGEAATPATPAPPNAPIATTSASPAPTSAPRPRATAVAEPATTTAPATTPADRIDTPLRIDWVGGSDVAWEAVSLPDGFARRVPAFADRPIEMRTRIAQGVLADGVLGFVRDAIAAQTDAIVMSINPVWLHWDESSCVGIVAQHARYECLLTPTDPAVTEVRRAELQTLLDAAVDADVPVYVYTQPHSADVLANPALAPRLEAAEEAIAAFDPARADVRFVSRIFTRDLPPLREGAEFIDMVHPTVDGAETLADWLAVDISRFWSSIDLGR